MQTKEPHKNEKHDRNENTTPIHMSVKEGDGKKSDKGPRHGSTDVAEPGYQIADAPKETFWCVVIMSSRSPAPGEVSERFVGRPSPFCGG